jgi:hypothetical protein
MDIYGTGSMSDSSKKLYASKIKILNGKEAPKTLGFLKKTDSILEKIAKYENPNTRRSFYIAVVSALKDRKGFKKAYDIYHKNMMDMNTTLNKESFKSDKTKEKLNITQEQLVARQAELEPALLLKGKTLKDEDYKNLTHLLITSLYTLIKPRRALDYSAMVVGEPVDQEHNYYHNGKFYFRNFKTKKGGEEIVDVPDKLQKIIKLYMKHKKYPESKFLLHTRDKAQMKSANDMNDLIKKAFGLNVGVSALRNIFLSDKYSDVVKDLKEDVADMGTSVNVALGTYIQK